MITDNIDGWFNFHGLYLNTVNNASEPAHFVEVGTWKGKSAAYMAEVIKVSGKDIKFDCVDTWLGSEEHVDDPDVINNTLYETFMNNMAPLKGFFNPLRMPSVDAANFYRNQSLDFVYIDAAHDYDNVRADIEAWWPKVKIGGTIAGHDIFHPPVKQAVLDVLGEYHEAYNSWIVNKNQP